MFPCEQLRKCKRVVFYNFVVIHNTLSLPRTMKMKQGMIEGKQELQSTSEEQRASTVPYRTVENRKKL
jgi:hypothetical protein